MIAGAVITGIAYTEITPPNYDVSEPHFTLNYLYIYLFLGELQQIFRRKCSAFNRFVIN